MQNARIAQSDTDTDHRPHRLVRVDNAEAAHHDADAPPLNSGHKHILIGVGFYRACTHIQKPPPAQGVGGGHGERVAEGETEGVHAHAERAEL